MLSVLAVRESEIVWADVSNWDSETICESEPVCVSVLRPKGFTPSDTNSRGEAVVSVLSRGFRTVPASLVEDNMATVEVRLALDIRVEVIADSFKSCCE